MLEKYCDILVVGTELPGLVSAAFLARRGLSVQILDTNYEQAKIAIIGVGGGGGNTVQHIINSGVEGVEYICANTDAQALSMVQNAKTLKLGKDITKGLGAGNNPEAGRVATEVCREEISDLLKSVGFSSVRLQPLFPGGVTVHQVTK